MGRGIEYPGGTESPGLAMEDCFLQNLRSFFQKRLDPALELLKTLVNFESCSTDKTAIDKLTEFVYSRFASMDIPSVVHQISGRGNCVSAVWKGSGRAEPVLVLGHLDTVWPSGTLDSRPFRLEGGRAFGPGVYDMKSGVALSLLLAEALAGGQVRAAGDIRFFYASDEEIGTDASLPYLREIARDCRAVYCLEPPLAAGEAKTSRKGVGNFLVRVRGIASHAGVAPEKGANAIVELSRVILEFQSMNEGGRSVSVSPGLIRGGVASNVVPDYAEAEIDFRFYRASDGAAIEAKAKALRTSDPRCTLTVEGGINRPPLERTPAVLELFSRAQGIAAKLGMELGEGGTGGASDGSLTASWGIPTLDGLGVLGSGAHAVDEQIEVADIPFRAALLCGLACLKNDRAAAG
jgi:glutamate carboxypeptidase